MDPHQLVGTWDFSREIHDHRDGTQYAAHGQATFTAEDDGRVRWSEHGTLTWAAGSTAVWRTLFLVRGPGGRVPSGDRQPSGDDAAGWRVTFEDGRDFHPWTVGAVEHLCGRDLYAGGVELPGAPRPGPAAPPWHLTWRVTGPEKDYTMHTRYTLPR